jgi:hypothetical protein
VKLEPHGLSDQSLVIGLTLVVLVLGSLIWANVYYGPYLGCAIEVGGVGFGCPKQPPAQDADS